jgi:hypothetical protein
MCSSWPNRPDDPDKQDRADEAGNQVADPSPQDDPKYLKMALAIAAPTMPSTIFMIIPMLLFMNCSASQPAIPPMMMAAIQPTPASPMAHLLEKQYVAPEHVAPNEWLTIDLDQRASTESRAPCCIANGLTKRDQGNR